MEVLFFLKVVAFTICLCALILVSFGYSCVYEQLPDKEKKMATVIVTALLALTILLKP